MNRNQTIQNKINPSGDNPWNARRLQPADNTKLIRANRFFHLQTRPCRALLDDSFKEFALDQLGAMPEFKA